MSKPLHAGSKIRALRRREGLTQAQLADRLDISASYLNLIENNRRPLTARLLLQMAEEFGVQLTAFATGDESRLLSELGEVFADPVFEGVRVTNNDLRDLVVSQPEVGSAIVHLYTAYREAVGSAETLAESLDQHESRDAVLAATSTEEINDLFQTKGNYFEQLEQAAEELWAEARLDREDVYSGLIEYLRSRHGIETVETRAAEDRAMRRFDPERKKLTLSEVLAPRSRRFQLAHQVGLIAYGDRIDSLGLEDELSSKEANSLCRVALANYFAAAVLMPYQSFLDDATESRYDIELLAHRYRVSFEQACHRLTTLRRPGSEGIPLHFIRIDIAGNISKRFSASGIRMPRFSGACPRWNVHRALLTPGLISIQLSQMPDGSTYFCVARSIQQATGAYNSHHLVHSIGIGCDVQHASKMIYSDGIDLLSPRAVTPVGVTCRTCDRVDCEQRVVPSMQRPLTLDENVRGMSFFSPIDDSDLAG